MSYPDAEAFLKAIGEETRLKIVSYLTHDSFCVCELVKLFDMSQPSISQHLKRLKQVDIIVEERKGRWVYYSLNPAHPLYSLILQLTGMLPSKTDMIQAFVVDGKRILCE